MIKAFTGFLVLILTTGCGFTGKRVITQNPLGADASLTHAQVGISIKNCKTGDVITAHNEKTSLHPASVLKLITTASSLELLESDFHFQTRLKYSGEIKDGILYGNLIIEGGGDPSLGSEYFQDEEGFIQEWIHSLQQHEIRSIKGDIISYHGLFDNEAVSGRWIWEDIGNYYGTGAYGLSVFDNSYKVHFRSTKLGQKAKVAMIQPKIPGLQITSEAIGGKSKYDSAYIYGDPQNYHKVIRGSIPPNKMDFSIKGAIPDPPMFLARHFHDQMEAEGIKLEGKACTSSQKIAGKVLHKVTSPDLQELISVINRNSNNQYSEHLLRMLSEKESRKSSYQGIHSIKNFWSSNKFDVSGLFMFDGSGLAPANAVNAEFITDVLTYMHTESNNSNIFKKTLPKAGLEGSVSYFLKSSSLKGNVWVKSGSMDRVKCFAGYFMKDESPYAFTILVNQFNGHSANIVKLIETYLENIYSQL